MKSFHCRCGQMVFFDSEQCVACGSQLGFDPQSFTLTAYDPGETSFRRCANGVNFDACNWLVPGEETHELCWGCRFNRTIPNMDTEVNRERFRLFEAAKKRLLYTLRSLQMPLSNGFDDPATGLLFDFIEDSRSNPEQYPESFVQTGFQGGIITINSLEADEVARELARQEMNESYRTLLGHLRHESGHYFEALCRAQKAGELTFDKLFGEADSGYSLALEAYYANGPVANWQDHYVSAYASAHPKEDWAECWAHYLYIHDALETACDRGVIKKTPQELSIDDRLDTWAWLSVALNELNRSSGLSDAYPFVLNPWVRKKIGFIDSAVARIRAENPVQAGY